MEPNLPLTYETPKRPPLSSSCSFVRVVRWGFSAAYPVLIDRDRNCVLSEDVMQTRLTATVSDRGPLVVGPNVIHQL
jgi:hypothetical protein